MVIQDRLLSTHNCLSIRAVIDQLLPLTMDGSQPTRM